MYITNNQFYSIKIALDLLKNATLTESEKADVRNAYKVLDELEDKRNARRARIKTRMAEHRTNDPLYGRSAEYKAKRLEKARQIVKIYGKEGN